MAVSINLRDIVAEEKKVGSSYLTGRALESLVALLIALGISWGTGRRGWFAAGRRQALLPGGAVGTS